MSNNKHTPGPWKCKKYPKVFSINAENGRQLDIKTEHHGDEPLTPMHSFERSKQDATDAYLIAAAPELLEALEDLLAAYNADLTFEERVAVRHRALDAVSKARGYL
jgi:beta-mannanase